MMRTTMGIVRRQAELCGFELPEKGRVRKRQIERFLPPTPHVVEAGAHIGIDTASMARRWRHGRIYAFEPVPALYRQLLTRVRRFGNVSTYQLALAGTSGELSMNVSSGGSDGSSSLLRPQEHLRFHPNVTFDDVITVQATTLDEWASAHSVKPDLLWLDAQGAELQILRSGTSVLESVAAIYTEVSLVQNYSDGPLYPELASWLSRFGFKPVIERIAWTDGGNVLFSR